MIECGKQTKTPVLHFQLLGHAMWRIQNLISTEQSYYNSLSMKGFVFWSTCIGHGLNSSLWKYKMQNVCKTTLQMLQRSVVVSAFFYAMMLCYYILEDSCYSRTKGTCPGCRFCHINWGGSVGEDEAAKTTPAIKLWKVIILKKGWFKQPLLLKHCEQVVYPS